MSDIPAKVELARRLLMQGNAAQAEAELRRALRAAPGNADLNIAMAIVLNSVKPDERAVYFAERAASARPNDPALLTNLGMVLGSVGRHAEALPRFERAAALQPGLFHARHGLATVLRELGRHLEAVEQARIGMELNPADTALAEIYASSLTHCARVPESTAFVRARFPAQRGITISGIYANAMTYDPTASPAESLAAQADFGRILAASVRPLPEATPDANPDRPLRVGLLSAELRRHAVATFLEPWLAHHDRGSLSIHCYAAAATEDHVSDRIKSATASWVKVTRMSDEAVAARVRADRIDILVETSGITQGQRLAVMAMRPAPVQVSCVGYLNSTGVTAIDHRLVDAHTDPPGSDALSVERLERLHPTCWCYRPAEVAPDPAAPAGPVVFGSFNSTVKINERVIALWSRILLGVPGSRLLLKAFDFADGALRRDVAARFEAAGVAPGRVEIEGPTQDLGSFLANYNRIHIGLDPFPFNGTTTTLDALWMGVPVVCLEGVMHAGRTGVSIMRTLGADELLAPDEDRYARIALDLASDPDRVAAYRRTLRARVAASALCDGPGHARRMDAAFRAMWRRWCDGRGR